MKLFTRIAVAGLIAAAPTGAQAQEIRITASDSGPAKIVDRASLSSARASAVTRNQHAVVLLNRDHVVLQLTDEGLASVRREVRNDTAGGLGNSIIRAMFSAGLAEFLDHGIAYPLDSLGSATVENGELVLEDRAGARIFEGVELNGTRVMAEFDPAAARRFANAVNRALRERR